MIVTSGGIGANHELVRAQLAASASATPPKRDALRACPTTSTGGCSAITEAAGGSVINPDRMWHYTEGIAQLGPDLEPPRHPDPPRAVVAVARRDAAGGCRVPLFPGFDTLGTLAHIMRTGHDHTWFVLTQKIIEKEFALSGLRAEPRPHRQSIRAGARDAASARARPRRSRRSSATAPTSSSSATSRALVRGMNALTGEPLLDLDALEREIVARDREIDNPFTKDLQVTAIHGARRYLADRLTRVAAPHRILDPAAGPLIAVRLSILTRKTLGGLADRPRRAACCSRTASRCPALYAAGEVAGFGGGGMHGYRALEGTFLGGCLFSGRTAGRAAAAALA